MTIIIFYNAFTLCIFCDLNSENLLQLMKKRVLQ